MKTAIFYIPKGSRKPKMQGLATAEDSAAAIDHFYRRVKQGNGRAFLVDCATAEHGRRIIKTWQTNTRPDIGAPAMTGVHLDGRFVAIGVNAVLAIAGASEAVKHWELRRQRDGRVKGRDTRAIGQRSDIGTPDINDYFGRNLGRNHQS